MVTVLGSVGCSAADPEGGSVSQREMALDPVDEGVYGYLRGNATSWGADATSAMVRVAPGVYEKTFQVTSEWELRDGARFMITFTDAEDGWGTENFSYVDPNHLSQPMESLGVSNMLYADDYATFIVKVPDSEEYKLTVNDSSPYHGPTYVVTAVP